MIGIRELRAELATHVRRAAAGESTLVSVGGRPAAVLAPLGVLDTTGEPRSTDVGGDTGGCDQALAVLVASGAVQPPRRTDGRLPERTVPVWANLRLDRLLAEIRG